MDWLIQKFYRLIDTVYNRSVSAQTALRRTGLQLFLVPIMAGHRFNSRRGFGRATELAYGTLLALVPVTALTLMIITSFSSSTAELEQYLFRHLIPASVDDVSGYLTRFATNAGAISLVSSLLLIVTAINLLMSIESAIDHVWELEKPRGFLVKMAAYWTLLTLGPLLMFSSLYLTAQLRQAAQFDGIVGFNIIEQVVSYILSLLAVWIVYYLIYTWLPNTRVKPAAGLVGAVIAGTLWEVAKFGFAWYVTQAVTYNKIYGSLSVLPLFLLWIYLTWIIVLWGSHVTYVWQHLTHMRHPASGATLSGWQRVDIAIRMLVCIAQQFQEGKGKVSVEAVMKATQVSIQKTQEIASSLEKSHMIQYIDEQDGWYILSQPPEAIALADVFNLFDGIESNAIDLTDEVGTYNASLGNEIRQSICHSLAGKNIKTLMDDMHKPLKKKSKHPVSIIQ